MSLHIEPPFKRGDIITVIFAIVAVMGIAFAMPFAIAREQAVNEGIYEARLERAELANQ